MSSVQAHLSWSGVNVAWTVANLLALVAANRMRWSSRALLAETRRVADEAAATVEPARDRIRALEILVADLRRARS